MSEAVEVVVIGNAGVDTNVYLPGGEVDWKVEANFTENLDCVGQAGAYASRGYAALGRRTAFIGALGQDPLGAWVRDTLAGDGIDVRGIFTDPKGTARSVNLMYRDGRRKNFYDGKGHDEVHPDPGICAALFEKARLAHFNIPDWARRLLEPARKAGIRVACDLQDVVNPEDAYRRDFIEAADLLFFSAANHGDPDPLIRSFLKGHPDRLVVAGMGPRGCALGRAAGIRHFPPPALDLPLRDTNGAGDSLAVGFLVSHVLEGRSLEDSILRGQIAARHACAQRGRTDALIRAEALERHARLLQDENRS